MEVSWRVAVIARKRAEAQDYRNRAKQVAAWSERDAAHYAGFAEDADASADYHEAELAKEEGE